MNSIWFYGPEGAEHTTGLTRPRAEELYAEKVAACSAQSGHGVKLVSTTGKVLQQYKGSK